MAPTTCSPATVIGLRSGLDAIALTGTIVEAIADDDADLALDLTEVQYMSAATVEVILRARDFLRLRSRSLTLRFPARGATRILEMCALSGLLDPLPADPGGSSPDAREATMPVGGPPPERTARLPARVGP
jgi:anti-anti-sigma regulatory factor